MSTAEKLRALLVLNDEQDDVELPIDQIVAVIEAAEQTKHLYGELRDALTVLDEALSA